MSTQNTHPLRRGWYTYTDLQMAKRKYSGRIVTPGASSLSRSAKKESGKRYTRKTWPYATTRNYMRIWDPFPAVAMARMRYSEQITLTPNTGVTAFNLFRAGSIYDPNQTSTGHQPYGHDTYASIYNHYRVIRSIIRVTAASNNTGQFGISLKDDASVEGNYDTVREAKGTNFTVMSSAGPLLTVENRYNSKMMPNAANNSANFGANPPDDVYFMVWYQANSVTSNGSACNFNVCITYDVMMYELKDLGQS